jgi:hypothetical protein
MAVTPYFPMLLRQPSLIIRVPFFCHMQAGDLLGFKAPSMRYRDLRFKLRNETVVVCDSVYVEVESVYR